MKKVIIAIVIIVIFITAGILEQVLLNKYFSKLEDMAEFVRSLVEQKDFEAAHEKTLEMQKSWSKMKHIVEAVISHNETKEVTMRSAELEGYIAANDDKSAIATASIMADYCANLKHILGFSWDTIL